jgi:RNA polymerase sigma factor (sigma-70 family)
MASWPHPQQIAGQVKPAVHAAGITPNPEARTIVSAEDAILVRCCLKGDESAIGALVERFQSDVFGLCVRLLQHRQDAEDVTQEVFLRIFRSLKRWDSARPLKPWVMGIAVNRCRTWMSQRAKWPEPVDYLHETASRQAVDDGSELAREIQTALLELRWEYRTVFAMFHEGGLPYEEIAEAIEKPIGTVKTWLHRARLELLDRLRRRGMISEVEHELP